MVRRRGRHIGHARGGALSCTRPLEGRLIARSLCIFSGGQLLAEPQPETALIVFASGLCFCQHLSNAALCEPCQLCYAVLRITDVSPHEHTTFEYLLHPSIIKWHIKIVANTHTTNDYTATYQAQRVIPAEWENSEASMAVMTILYEGEKLGRDVKDLFALLCFSAMLCYARQAMLCYAILCYTLCLALLCIALLWVAL